MAVLNRRLVLDSFRIFRMEETPIPQPPEGGLVVKISNAGICYSDVHMAHTPKFHPKIVYPRVLGHEISGTVHKMSSAAGKARPDLSIGDRVVVFPWGNCQQCNYCKGDCSFCHTMAYGAGPVGAYVYGIWRDGGYENYVVVDIPEFLLKVPDGLAMNAAATIPCSGLTSYNAVTTLRESIERAKRVNGVARVGVIGAGGLALWAIQITKALYSPGVQLIAVDVSDEKLADAKDHGADMVHKWGRDESTQEAVEALVSQCGRLDAAIEFICVPSTIDRTFLSLNIGGTLCLVGLSGTVMPEMTLNSVIRRNVTIRGNLVGSLPQLQELMQLVRENKVKPPPICDVKLDDVPGVMQKMMEGRQKGRAVVQM